MDVKYQAPQPTIQCYHSTIKVSSSQLKGSAADVIKNLATQESYYDFTPESPYLSGKNLQSYNFERSLDNFGGSFSFTVKEDISSENLFMDEVEPLDIIKISESGSEQKIDFIGVVTKISIGATASTLNKVVTVSGNSIEWLFSYYNINTDIKGVIFQNEEANNTFKTDLAKRDGEESISIKDIVLATYDMFEKQVTKLRANQNVVTNFLIGGLIKKWFGDDFVDASDDTFFFPISSNLFTDGTINIIDYLRKLLPSPIYEIFGFVDITGKPKIKVRKVPFDNPTASVKIQPELLTDFTLTRTCDEVYTAFLPYVEGSSMSPDFYMNLETAEGIKEKGYNSTTRNEEKIKKYGYQLLTCSFVGYSNTVTKSGAIKEAVNMSKLSGLADDLNKWFGNLDEMYSGDFTIVNVVNEKHAHIGEWIGFADGIFYIINESHTWNYGDNPTINYQVIRGGEYVNNTFKPLKRLSAAYKEFD